MDWGIRRVIGLCCALALSLGVMACEDPAAPIVSATELHLRQIYDAGEWLKRVPVQLATSLYVRSKVESFLADLELPRAVHQRVTRRLDSEDFVDELIPFLLFVREMYKPPEGFSSRDFDEYFRAHFRPRDDIPGLTHDMFAWKRKKAEDGGGELPGLAPDVAQELVMLYDALYLQEHAAATAVDERLACESRQSGPALEAITQRATSSIRSLVGALRRQMAGADESGTESEIGDALQGLLDDPDRLEAATAAVVRFIDQTVCRNYRFFAARAFRAKQLERWMLAELDAPGGGELWAYLEHANRERRYGAVIVVDGLQGRLMEALAAGKADAPFLRAIAAEQRARGGAPPRASSLRAPDPQQTDFLEHLTEHDFAHPHYLRFFKRLQSDPDAAWIPVGISTTPTISVRNIPISLTGAPVAGPHSTGLPNFHFVDRHYQKNGETRGRAYYFYGSDAVELVSLTQRAGMQTLPERLPHLSSLSCTAQYDEAAQFGIDALLNLGLGERLRDFGDRLCAAELERRARTERELRGRRQELLALRDELIRQHAWWKLWTRFGQSTERGLAERYIAEIANDEQRAMPELLLYYNPWPDHFAHFEGPFADEIISPSGELNRLDYWLTRIQRAYEDAGVMGRAVFGMAGDHGLSPVFHLLNPEVEIFDALREEGIDFRLEKISSDEGEGPKLTNPFDPPSMKGIDVVVASTAGGNYMLDLFEDQGEGFTSQPLARDLRAIRPLAAAPDSRSIDLLAEITTRLGDSLDYLAVRDEACSPERCSVRVMRNPGEPAEGLIRREGRRIHYSFEGSDPLDTGSYSQYEELSEQDRAEHARLRRRCLAAAPNLRDSWCTEREWRQLTSFTPRPDSVVQLSHLYDSERAGSVNLFPREGVGYNSQVPGRHAGESFHEKNAFVAIWGDPLQSRGPKPPRRSAVNGSVPMLIFEWLGETTPIQGRDGWGYQGLEGVLQSAR
jgi:hypothetical protein